MTLEDAKKFYFDNGCSSQNMYFNGGADDYNEFNKVVTPELITEFDLEYLPLAFDEIYEKKSKSGYAFLRILGILERRDLSYSEFAGKLVGVFEECPFALDDQALMVAEWMLGSGRKNLLSSGMAILQFYGDYADRIYAAVSKYMRLQFSSDVVTMFDMKPYPAEKLNMRVEALGEARERVLKYVKSSKLEEDYREMQKKTLELKTSTAKDNKKMTYIIWFTILGTALFIGLLSFLVYMLI